MEVIMPKMGESINEGTIIKWHKKVGDIVKKDEIIFEISTDKVDTEIPSPSDGILSEIKVNEGDTVQVGTIVALISSSINGEGQQANKVNTAAAKSEENISLKESVKEEIKNSPEMKMPVNDVKKSEGELFPVLMPKMGESVMEGTILKWHKKVGDKINKDEILFEISTDKVDTEVPSPAEGILAEIIVGEQETVEVGTIVAKITSVSKNEIIQGEGVVSSETNKSSELVEKYQEPQAMHDNFSKQIEGPGEKKTSSDKFLSPLVMNIMKIEGITFDEIDNIQGSGLDGRISKKDVLAYLETRNKQKVTEVQRSQKVEKQIEEKPLINAKEQSATIANTQTSADVERIPMNNIRQKIMQHMVNSRDTSVHVSAMLEVDMTKIYNFLKDNKAKYSAEGVKLTYLSFIAYATVKALKEYPLVNSSIEENTIIRKKFINLGIAVSVEPNGLIVPNIKNAEDKNVIGLAKSISDLAYRTRNKKLVPDDISNGTFSITNYGVFGTIFGTPTINQPEVAILGVGALEKKPVVIELNGNDVIAIKPIMALTISHDHRLIDGMLGGKFIKYIKDYLENFNVEDL